MGKIDFELRKGVQNAAEDKGRGRYSGVIRIAQKVKQGQDRVAFRQAFAGVGWRPAARAAGRGARPDAIEH
jgi:hypothetical protein